MESSHDIQAESIVVRFAGDSGDGVQLMGTQFVSATALEGSDFATFPDYPAEIRAPVGTTFGVSAYQINLGARPITTAGDAPKVLVAFNPAALKVNLPLLDDGALIVLNIDSFTPRNLAKAGYSEDPRKSGVLDAYQLVEVDVTVLTIEAVKPFGLSKSDAHCVALVRRAPCVALSDHRSTNSRAAAVPENHVEVASSTASETTRNARRAPARSSLDMRPQSNPRAGTFVLVRRHQPSPRRSSIYAHPLVRARVRPA
jgi:Pyruvate/2-oxoacid:ferredoxin oxidoreductase gamma subunit